MKKVKIAQIGTSKYSHGRQCWDSLKKQSEIFDIAGYALPESENTKFPELMRAYEGYRLMTVEEILNDSTITAVAIETEEKYLAKYALMAARAGKHIHLEKPGGTDFLEFKELVHIMQETGKVLHLGYMYRYNPFIMELLARIKSGELGEILSVEAHMSCFHKKEVRQWLQELPGGMMLFLGCHLVDLILQIQGKPKRILPLNKGTTWETDALDFGMVIFEYDKGISFAKTTALEVGGYARRQLVVIGTEGTVEIKPLEMFVPGEATHFTEKTEYFDKAWHNRGVHSQTERFDRYDGMMAAFATYVRGETENPYTLDYELELYKTVLETCSEIDTFKW